MAAAVPPPAAITAAARHLSRALLSVATTSQSWTSSHEDAIHRFLLSLRRGRHPHGSDVSPHFLSPSLLSATIDPHLLPHQPLALGLFHWSSQQPGFSHTAQTFHSVLLSLSRSRRPRALKTVLNHAASSGVLLSPLSSFLAAKSLLLCNQTFEAFKLVNGVRTRVGFSPGDNFTEEICNSLLAAAAEEQLWDLVWKLFDEMLHWRVAFNDVGFGVLIHGICRSSGMEEAMAMVDRAQDHGLKKLQGSLMAVLFVDGLCLGGRAEEGWRALEELRKRGLKPDFVPYRIVAEEFKKSGRIESSLKILKQKRKFGVAPRTEDYGEYILRLISERRILPAKRLGEALASGDFPVDSCVLNALIGSVSVIDAASSLELCRFMAEKRGEPPSLLSLRNLCGNLCKNGKGEEMWEIFSSLLSKGFLQDAEGHGLIVFFLCKAGKVREAYQIIREMKKRGLQPDLSSYNSLMEACCREDLIRPAKKLWDEMFAGGCSGDLRTFKTLICKLSEIRDADGATRLFRLMEEKNLTPDETIYKAITKVLCSEGKFEEARAILEKTLAQGSDAIAGSILSALVLDLCRNGEFEAAIAMIRRSPPAIQSSSHAVLMKSLAEAGLHDQAVEHVEWIRDNGKDPGLKEKILRELAGSLSISPNLEAVLRLLQALRQRSLLPDDGPWADLCHGHQF